MSQIAYIANKLVRPKSFWVTTKQAAAMLGKSEWYIRNRYKEMKLEVTRDFSNGKKGKSRLYCLNSIHRYHLNELKELLKD